MKFTKFICSTYRPETVRLVSIFYEILRTHRRGVGDTEEKYFQNIEITLSPWLIGSITATWIVQFSNLM